MNNHSPLCVAEFILECPLFVLFYLEILRSFVQIFCLENKGFSTFQNSKLKFVKLDKIYFLPSGNLFSDWQQIFCSTSIIREIKQSGLELCIKISCFKPMQYPTSNIEIVARRICLLHYGCLLLFSWLPKRKCITSSWLHSSASITFLLNLFFAGT